MTSTFLLLAALSCPKVIVANVSGYPWNAHDETTQRYCERRCKVIYKDAPCLKLFRKYGKKDYTAICGVKE